ncbi:hypothetical protein XPA_005342 [Xanthoria parietina]
MGAWGYQLFNSDNEFDVVISDIDEQARKLAKDPKLTLYEPKNNKRVVMKACYHTKTGAPQLR